MHGGVSDVLDFYGFKWFHGAETGLESLKALLRRSRSQGAVLVLRTRSYKSLDPSTGLEA